MAAAAAPAELPATSPARRKPYRVPELAELWDIDNSTIYRMIHTGRLRAERHGSRGGALRIPVDAVVDYLRQATTEPSEVAMGEYETTLPDPVAVSPSAQVA